MIPGNVERPEYFKRQFMINFVYSSVIKSIIKRSGLETMGDMAEGSDRIPGTRN